MGGGRRRFLATAISLGRIEWHWQGQLGGRGLRCWDAMLARWHGHDGPKVKQQDATSVDGPRLALQPPPACTEVGTLLCLCSAAQQPKHPIMHPRHPLFPTSGSHSVRAAARIHPAALVQRAQSTGSIVTDSRAVNSVSVHACFPPCLLALP